MAAHSRASGLSRFAGTGEVKPALTADLFDDLPPHLPPQQSMTLIALGVVLLRGFACVVLDVQNIFDKYDTCSKNNKKTQITETFKPIGRCKKVNKNDFYGKQHKSCVLSKK